MPDSNRTDYMYKISADTSEFNKKLDDAETRAREFADSLKRANERWSDFSRQSGMKAVNEEMKTATQYVAEIQKKYQDMYDLSRQTASGMKEVSKALSDTVDRVKEIPAQAKEATARINEMMEAVKDSDGGKRIIDDIRRVRAELEEIGGARFESPAHAALGQQIEKAEEAVEKLTEKQKQLDAGGVSENAEAYKDLVARIQEAKAKVEDLERKEQEMEASGKAYTFGTDSKEYQKKEQELAALNEQLERYYEDQKRLDEIVARALGKDLSKDVQDVTEEATESITSIQEQVKAGTKAIADDVKRVSEEFSNLAGEHAPENGVQEMSEQVDEAIQKTSIFQALLQRLKIPDDTADDVDEITDRTSRLADLWRRFTLPEGAFSEKAEKIRAEIEEIEARMHELSETQIETDEYAEFQKQLDNANQRLESLLDKQDKMRAVGVKESSSAWKNLQYDISRARQEIQAAKEAQEEMRQEGSAFIPGADSEEFSGLESRLDELRGELEEVENEGTSKAQNIGAAFRDGFARIAKGGLDVFKRAWAGVGKQITNGLKNIKSGFQSFVSHIKNIRKESTALNAVVKKVHRNFTSFASLLKTRVKRMFISEVFKDMKEDVGLIAQTSDRFNSAISGMIDSCKAFGLQIVAAFEPLVSIVGPYVSQFIDGLTAAADKIAQFIARLTGNETYLKATKGQTDYAKSLDKTTKSTEKAEKATKRYQNTVLSFDQLHKLNGVDDTTDDASNITGVTDAQLNKAQTQATALNGIADKIREALKAGKFKEAGRQVGGLVNDAFAWLKNAAGWEKNAEKFTKAIKNFVDFVNGIAEGLDGKAIGNAIGDIANTLIEGFGLLVDPEKGIDFTLWGQKLGDLIVSAVQEIHWKKLGEDFVNGVQGIVDFVTGMITRDGFFEELGDALSDAFAGIVDTLDAEKWATAISGLINGFFTFLEHAFSDTEKMAELGRKLAEFLNRTFEELDAEQATTGINKAVEGITNLINTFLEEVHWGDILDKLGEIMSGLDWLGIAEIVGVAAAPSIVAGFLGSVNKFILGGGAVSLLGTGLGKLGSLIFGAAGSGAGTGAGILGTVAPIATGAAATIGGGYLGVNGAAQLGLIDKEWAAEYNKNPVGNFFDSIGALITKSPVAALWDEDVRHAYFGGGEKSEADIARDEEKRTEETETHDNVNTVKDAVQELKTSVQEEFARQAEAVPAADAVNAAEEKFVDVLTERWEVEDDLLRENFSRTIETIRFTAQEIIQAIGEAAQASGSGDVVLVVDSEEIARASTRGQRSIDKRTNPSVSFA